MSNTDQLTAEKLMIEVAPLVIHEMKQAKLTEAFVKDESMRLEIIEICLTEVSRKWEKMAVLARTNPAFIREMLNHMAA